MKKIITIICTFNISIFIFSQTDYIKNKSINQLMEIKGELKNEENQGIDFASCFLHRDSLLIGSTLTDSLGCFIFNNLQRGKYVLTIRYFSNEKQIDILSLGSDTLINVTLNLTNELEEITVNYKKPLIEKKVDRIVFNVDNSIASIGLSALELLAKTPGIRVSNSSVSIIGKSNINVMIDEKLIQLSGEDLMIYLKTISSDDISKIEVITSPPSKFDAQGNCGIINIILKKSRKKGYNGSAHVNFAKNTYSSGSGGCNLNYNKAKLSLQSGINFNNGANAGFELLTTKYPSNTWKSSDISKQSQRYVFGDFGIEYRINDKSTVGLTIQGGYVETMSYNKIDLKIISGENLDSTVVTKSNSTMNYNTLNSNLYFDRTIDTLGKKIRLNLDWFHFTNKNNLDYCSKRYYINDELVPNSISNISSNGSQFTNAYTLNLNFDLPFKKCIITTGAKSSYISNLNNFNFYNVLSNTSEFDSAKSNNFNYYETIQAIYFDISKEIGDWSFKGGLRAEYTEVKGKSITLNLTNNYNYLKLFPSAFIQRKINENNALGLTYGRRINRPDYWELNPFRWYLSPYSYSVGNPFLQPSFNNNIELSHVHKNSLITAISYSKQNNGFGQIATIDSNSVYQIFNRLNYLNTDLFSLNVTFIFNKLKWWENSNQLSIYHVTSKSNSKITLPIVKGFGAFVITNNQFIFNKRKTFIGECNFWYSFPSIEGITNINAFYSLDFGIRYSMLQKRLKISLHVSDIFKSDSPSWRRISNGIVIDTEQYHDNRQVRISLSYNFGNDKIQPIEKEILNSEEQNRAN